MYVYRWEATREYLHDMRAHDGNPYEAITIEYTDPTTGGPVYNTMTFRVQLLRPGEKTLPVQQNASLICTILEGSGTSQVGEERFDWTSLDTFCVPGGTWYEHHNNTDRDAIVFVTTDEPALKAFGLQVKRGRLPSGEIVRLDDGD